MLVGGQTTTAGRRQTGRRALEMLEGGRDQDAEGGAMSDVRTSRVKMAKGHHAKKRAGLPPDGFVAGGEARGGRNEGAGKGNESWGRCGMRGKRCERLAQSG